MQTKITRTLASNGSVASFQITNSIPDAQGSPINLNPTLMKMEGYFISGAALWLQLWDLNADPANATSSAYSEAAGGCRRVVYLGALQSNGFLWQYMDAPLSIKGLTNGLRAVLSTTADTYTAANGTTQKSTFFIELEDWEIEKQGLTAVGDTTTSVPNLTVWADAAGNTKKLQRLEVIGPAAVSYLQLFAKAPSVNDKPFQQFPVLGVSENRVERFGFDGASPFSIVSGVQYVGCYAAISLTSGSYDGATTMKCRGYYK